MNWKRIVSACVFLGTLTLFANTGVPQYVQSNLAADPTGPPAVNIDPDLINAWGLTSCRLDRLEDDAKSLESFIGRFTDLNTNLPGNPGMTVYNAQNVNGKLYVTFATFTFLGGGVVDIFDTDGNLLTPEHLTANPGSSGPLQAPWGVALAPEDFGQFSSAILIGNVDDGHINAFDRHTHQFLGQLTDVNGNLLLETIYGGRHANRLHEDLFESYEVWLTISKAPEEERVREGYASPGHCQMNILRVIDEEIVRLGRDQQARAAVRTARTQLEIACRNVPDGPVLDRLLRYEVSLDRSFDRTLSQLERLQRIRKGQPVLPELKVRHSLS
jgi:hypothetical protein